VGGASTSVGREKRGDKNLVYAIFSFLLVVETKEETRKKIGCAFKGFYSKKGQILWGRRPLGEGEEGRRVRLILLGKSYYLTLNMERSRKKSMGGARCFELRTRGRSRSSPPRLIMDEGGEGFMGGSFRRGESGIWKNVFGLSRPCRREDNQVPSQ